jgi:hypothetical protein
MKFYTTLTIAKYHQKDGDYVINDGLPTEEATLLT